MKQVISRAHEQKQIIFVHLVKHDFVDVSVILVMLLPLSLSISLPGSLEVTGFF